MKGYPDMKKYCQGSGENSITQFFVVKDHRNASHEFANGTQSSFRGSKIISCLQVIRRWVVLW